MLNRLCAALVAASLLVPAFAAAQTVQPGVSVTGLGTPVSATTTTSRQVIPTNPPSSGGLLYLYNNGSVLAHIKTGNSSVNALAGTSGDFPLPGGTGQLFAIGSATHVAAITDSSSATISVYRVNGAPLSLGGGGAGGGGGGAVFGPTAVGSAAANPPVLVGGTVDGTAAANISVWKILAGIGYINCANCSGSGASAVDESTFTPGGSTVFAPGGGFFQTTATNNALANLQTGTFQVTAQRALFTNLRNASGAEVGISAAELFVGGRGTAGSAAGGVLTVQGVASMTPILATLSGTNNINTVTTVTAVTAITNALPSGTNVIGHAIIDTGSTTAVTQATSSNLKAQVDPLTAASWGIGTSTQNSASATNGQLALGQFNTSPTTITNGNMSPLQLDNAGKLLVNCTGCSSSSSITSWGGGTLGAMANYGTSPGAVLVPGVNAFVTNATPGIANNADAIASVAASSTSPVPVNNYGYVYNGATWDRMRSGTTTGSVLINGAGTAGSASGGVVTVQGAASMTPLLSNPGTAANWGVGATGSAVPANSIYHGGNAVSAEPAKATTGNLTGATFDLAGKQVTSPYALRESMLRCAITLTASTAATTCTGMGAQGASVKIYITDLTCTRSDAGTTSATMTLNDSATTIIDMPNNGGGGGFSKTYNVPLVIAANTAFQVQSGTSLTSVHCSAAGFAGY